MKVNQSFGGGIYAGITANNEHLILAYPHRVTRDLIWTRADEEARKIILEGNRCRLPHTFESALLYANLKQWFDDMWYWTADDYPADDTCKWVQTFGYGRQADARMTDACRMCAVYTFPV